MILSISQKLTCVLSAVLLCLLSPATHALAQEPTADQTDEVIRINTELVQTDVMVFDKQGRFVDNLQREQFELRVDGKPQPISFFDRVAAGSASEEAQLAAARGQARPVQPGNNPTGEQTSVGLFDRGRTVIFFIDDIHLAFDSLKRTQKVLLHFINDEMGQNDRVAIATTVGQLGFLQQLTDNKAVLRTAVERLKLQRQLINDAQQPPMPEYLALEIATRGNRDVLNYFVEPLVQQGMPVNIATNMVNSRASQILQQSRAFTRNTFFSLESLARTIAVVPGRKLVFFISDGFLLNSNETDIYDQLSRITNTAARNSVVIYTLDARGLSIPSVYDASSPGIFDPTGRVISAMLGETTATQEPLHTLAASTGGRALLNTNALDMAITKTLKETSTYYVIAWRPENEEQKKSKLRRIEVKVAGHSDYKVQVKSGFLTPGKEPEAKTPKPAEVAKKTKVKTPTEQLGTAIAAFYPNSTLPTSLSLDYLDAPQGGALLTISMQVPAEALSFEPAEGKYKAALDVGGNVYNMEGKVGATFQEHLNVSADNLELLDSHDHDIYYTSQVHLNPGLYQVRVAARDAKTGHIGVATQWVEVPELKGKRLALSSLFIGELTGAAAARNSATAIDATPPAKLNVARRFPKTSRLRFVTFIYNAQRGVAGTSAPDVAIQVQVLRDEQPLMTTPLKRVSTNETTDFARLPYAAEISLDNMLAGRYLLQVTVIDRIAKTSASQRVNFEVQ
jgi:VWFA-related protein